MKIAKIGIKVFSFFLLMFLFSCVAHKKTLYLQSENKKDKFNTEKEYKMFPITGMTIKPNDELHIEVSSLDEQTYNFFSQINQNNMGSSETSIVLESYRVSEEGYVILPIVGKFFVKGLTLNEASQKIQVALTSYLNQPSVVVKKVNKSISVIGEVKRPGKYFYTQHRINILEAIAMAGDVDIYGNRNKVTILREKDEQVYRYRVDITKEDLFFSEFYYLNSNDIVYVEPLWSKQMGIQTFPFALILSIITTYVLIANYIKNP